MTAQIIDGRALAKTLRAGFRERVAELVALGIQHTVLADILIVAAGRRGIRLGRAQRDGGARVKPAGGRCKKVHWNISVHLLEARQGHFMPDAGAYL